MERTTDACEKLRSRSYGQRLESASGGACTGDVLVHVNDYDPLSRTGVSTASLVREAVAMYFAGSGDHR